MEQKSKKLKEMESDKEIALAKMQTKGELYQKKLWEETREKLQQKEKERFELGIAFQRQQEENTLCSLVALNERKIKMSMALEEEKRKFEEEMYLQEKATQEMMRKELQKIREDAKQKFYQSRTKIKHLK